jgi:cysteine synthase/rhodanese-related sulfurtransferase
MPDHRLRIYDSMVDLLSNADNPTPLVRINRVVPFQHARVYGKLEWYNPFGAVKDRVATNLIADAEKRGVLEPGQKLVEPTSGNTGMGLAMISNVKGYSLTTPLSSAIPLEKRIMLRFFGADVLELDDDLCPAPGAPEGAIAKAHELADRPDFHMLDQYTNEANPGAHYKTTGPEIWKQTEGKVTHFVAGLGTCGTITGTGRFLKEQNPEVKVLGVHPQEGHDIPGVRSIRQLQQTALFRPDEYDELVEINDEKAWGLCQRLNLEESIIAGPSSAMALAGALRMVPDEPGVIAVVIFPDNAFKYASSMSRHIPGMDMDASGGASPQERMMATLIENTRGTPALTIDLEPARDMIEAGSPFVVDVREYDEFTGGHIPVAMNMPLGKMSDYAAHLPEDREAPVLVVCETGNRSLTGALFLASLGYRDVCSINGGTTGWREKGFEVSDD